MIEAQAFEKALELRNRLQVFSRDIYHEILRINEAVRVGWMLGFPAEYNSKDMVIGFCDGQDDRSAVSFSWDLPCMTVRIEYPRDWFGLSDEELAGLSREELDRVFFTARDVE